MSHRHRYYDNFGDYNHNWDNLLGFSPLIALGLGFLLADNRSKNTNIININTGRRHNYWDTF